MSSLRTNLAFAAGLVLLPSMAFAHPGHGTSGLVSGLSHPLFALDHLLAMVAVGLCAAKLGGTARWLLPVLFVSIMVLGGGVAIAGMHLPGVELGIIASVIVLGMLLIFARSGATVPAALLVSGFALFHGYAHGAEMPAAAGAATYAFGFAFATAALHGLGLLGGQWLQARHWQRAVQVLGALISMAGVSMALSM